MAPFKSSLAKSAGKLFGVFNQRDLSLRGATQSSRKSQDPFSASGGNSTYTYNGYKIHKFTSSGALSVASGSATVNIFMVAGGGSGARNHGAGGGAGGVVSTTTTVGPGPYTVTIGSGAPGPSVIPEQNGAQGENSAFGTILAAGGGGGAGPSGPGAGQGAQYGGSGGGGVRGSGPPPSAPAQPGNKYPDVSPTPAPLRGQAVTPTPQGNAGGNNSTGSSPGDYGAGGGGGAGDVGGSTSNNTGAAGGPANMRPPAVGLQQQSCSTAHSERPMASDRQCNSRAWVRSLACGSQWKPACSSSDSRGLSLRSMASGGPLLASQSCCG